MKAKLAINPIAAVAMVASMPVALAHDDHQEDLNPEAFAGLVRDVRQAANRFQDVNTATAEGYVSTASCVSGPNQGAMGVHYVNNALIEDGVLDVRRPEVLVYEPHEGGLRLVAVEFFVVAEQWDAANTVAPVIGGQHLNYVGAPNRLRLPAYYELHVWAWKRNSSGAFSDWNPKVSCTQYTGESARRN
jgi:hypothetical protein